MLNEINYVLFGYWKRYFFPDTPAIKLRPCLTQIDPNPPLSRGKNNKHFNWICFHVYFDPFLLALKRIEIQSIGKNFQPHVKPRKLVFMILYLELCVSVHSAKFTWMSWQRIVKVLNLTNKTLTQALQHYSFSFMIKCWLQKKNEWFKGARVEETNN